MEEIIFNIDEEKVGQRIDKYLSEAIEGKSRSFIQGLIDDENEDDCLIIINRSNDYKHIDFDLDYDLLDEIGIKYTPGDYGITLEKEDNKFPVDIDPKSFMIFKMKHIKKEEV